MAKPKKSSKASKSTAPKASKAKTARASAPSKSSNKSSSKSSEVERLLASWPPISDIQHAAFSAQYSDARCDQLGSKTQSAAVSKEAIGFAHVIDGALRKSQAALRRYAPARFVFFLESIAALDRARDEQASGKDTAAPARRSLDHARIRASEVRRELLHTLELLVGDHELDRAELDRATGEAKSDDALVSSLNDLARLADQWLRRTDGESRALVASVDLGRGDVDLAWATATELENAGERASGKRVNAAGRDTAPVNRAEGRVILEMRQAMRAFAHAAEGNKLIPRLVPGPGTRNVLAGHSAKGASKEASPAAPPN